jgi:hypothetical protein
MPSLLKGHILAYYSSTSMVFVVINSVFVKNLWIRTPFPTFSCLKKRQGHKNTILTLTVPGQLTLFYESCFLQLQKLCLFGLFGSGNNLEQIDGYVCSNNGRCGSATIYSTRWKNNASDFFI